MSKILKRPMFRIGGSANDGVMSIAAPRKNYQEGSDYQTAYEKIYPLLEKAAGAGPSVQSDLGDLLISGGLNLLSGKGAGKGTLGSLAESYRDPYTAFAKARSGEDALKRQLRLTAASQAMTSTDAEKLQRLKIQAEQQMLNQKLQQGEKELFIKTSQLGSKASGIFDLLNNLKEKGQPVTDVIINVKDNIPNKREIVQVPNNTIFVDTLGKVYKKTDDYMGYVAVDFRGNIPTAPIKPIEMSPSEKFQNVIEQRGAYRRKLFEDLQRRRSLSEANK